VEQREREVNKRRQIGGYTQEETDSDKIGIAEAESERERWRESTEDEERKKKIDGYLVRNM
jgi:hypothetical protein